MKYWGFIAYLLVILLEGCGDNPPEFEEYDLPESGAIILTQTNHPHGYGERECFYCHVKANIHQDNQTNSPLINLARNMTESRGTNACSACHGGNGL